MVIVTFDAGQILDVTGPLEVFSSASRFLPAVRYRTQVVTTRGGPVRANCGLEFASSAIGDVTGPVDTLMVAGGSGMDQAVADSELLAQIRRLAADARRVTSVCSGAFLLAAAGLLQGRRATTHWADCGQLDATYAEVTVDPDAIYVHDGNVWTSAGVTAGIDLALALVADDHGHQAAATVARQLVVYLQRSGGQAQFSALLAGAGRRHRAGARPAVLAARPPHRRPVRAGARPTGQPVRTTVHPSLQGPGGCHRGRPRRGRPARVRLPTAGDHQPDHRADRQNLRLRNTRDHEPHLPPPAQHHPRRPSSPLSRNHPRGTGFIYNPSVVAMYVPLGG